MKIDNGLFMFLLEKKKKGGTVLPVVLCIALLLGMFGGGFALGFSVKKSAEPAGALPAESRDEMEDVGDAAEEAQEPETEEEGEYVEGSYVTSMYLASMTKDKYEDKPSPYGYTYGPAITGIGRTENIVLQAGFSVDDLDVEYWTEVIGLYEDPQLQHLVGNGWDYDRETGTITMTPSSYPVGKIWLSGLSMEVVKRYDHDNLRFFPSDAGSEWGNLSTMYLATYYDLETGEKRDVPQVQVVTVKGELPDTPKLTCSFTDDGRVHFSWNEIAGAEEYFVCRYTVSDEYGQDGGLSVMEVTTDTEWFSASPEYGSVTTNDDFRNYTVAQNDWYGYGRERTIEEYGEEPIAILRENNRYQYCVIAVCKEGTSMMSNGVDILDIQENIPVLIAYDTWMENGYSYNGYDSVEQAMPYGYVTMADGMTAMKLIDYDTEQAMVVEDRYIYTDEEGNFLEGKNIDVLKIPYRIEGTPFEDVVLIVDYDESNLEKDLQFLEEREDMLRKRGGDVALNTDIEFDAEETADVKVREVDFEVTANCALSEYLAKNMLANVKVIDVSEFPEAADITMLEDAFLEAYHQNPLILGITGYKINRDGTAVKVAYDDNAEVTARKQEEIKEKVAQITAQIIKPGMTELEKELAINQYLCDTCEYDDMALQNAEENNFAYVDKKYDDSFTAYGALINGRCVCAGYAGAFKLLADAAGLQCVVVTGVLEGNLPHAWNKVRIDGEWEILDVTNNDNEFLSNALLNLPDEAGSRTLTEDSDYVLDSCMRNYIATNGRREYYRLHNLYYDYDEIGEKLAEQIEENGFALLRTEYALDDRTFYRIGRDVHKALEGETELYGCYWMGVIYLTTEEE